MTMFVLMFPIAAAATTLSAPPTRPPDYTEPRTATVNAAGAKVIHISGRAGFLHVQGKRGASQVSVRGMARADRERNLQDIRLVAHRTGDDIYIAADIPEQHDFDWRGSQALDLDIDVPDNVKLDVDDGSGDLTIRGTSGVDLHDGSGNIELENIAGDVGIEDGSGEITVHRVSGGVEVRSDGSGSVTIETVTGSVRIGRKGSGNVDVSDIGGDFTVEEKGSGGIEYQNVKGRVDVPARRHRRRYGS